MNLIEMKNKNLNVITENEIPNNMGSTTLTENNNLVEKENYLISPLSKSSLFDNS